MEQSERMEYEILLLAVDETHWRGHNASLPRSLSGLGCISRMPTTLWLLELASSRTEARHAFQMGGFPPGFPEYRGGRGRYPVLLSRVFLVEAHFVGYSE